MAGLWFLVLVNSIVLAIPVPSNCPIVCDCDEHLHVTTCTGGKLEQIPSTLPSLFELKELVITRNKVRFVNSSLTSYPNLEVLNLGKNEIKNINNDVFRNLSKLKALSLCSNQLDKVDSFTFRGLGALLRLDLSLNRLHSLPEDAFSDLKNLQILNLESNKLNTIHANAFHSLSKLQFLFLGDNLLQVFPSLSELFGLNSLFLDMNQIRVIPSFVFRMVPDVSELSLNGNLVSEIANDAFNLTADDCSNIKTLLLRDNLLPRMPQKALMCLENLGTLDLSGNLIEYFTYFDFRELLQLHTVILSNMPNLKVIGNGTFSAQQHLREVIIHSNRRLVAIHGKCFADALKLRRLDLHGNALQAIDAHLVSWDSLEFLDLRFNPWHCDCELQLLSTTLAVAGSNETRHLQSDARCESPSHLSSVRITELNASLNCMTGGFARENAMRETEDRILFGILGGTCLVLFMVMVVVLCKCHKSFLNPSLVTNQYSSYVPPTSTPTEGAPLTARESLSRERRLYRLMQANNQLSELRESDEKPTDLETPMVPSNEKKSEVRFSLDRTASN